MIGTLLKQVKQYKKVSILTPIFTALEVVMEVLIPFITASIIDKGIEAGDMNQVYFYGAIMLVMAFFSLLFGILAGRFAAAASSGFASNLRDAMYENIQTFSFSNIDKFSDPYDDGRDQCAECVSDDPEDYGARTVDAHLQHGDVFLYQFETQQYFSGGHGGACHRSDSHYEQDDKNF